MYLALRTARRIAGTFLPILSLGLIILSFGLDDWYSIHHLDGEKEEGSVWREYSVEYGLYEFHYLEVWSGILGDAYRESKPANPEGLESISDYMATSMGLVIILILISLVVGLLSMTEKLGPSLHMMMTLIMTMGLIITVSFYFFSIDTEVHSHIANGFDPVGVTLENDTRDSLKGSGEFGTSFYLLISSILPPAISFLLFIDPPKERDPSRSKIEDGFFKD